EPLRRGQAVPHRVRRLRRVGQRVDRPPPGEDVRRGQPHPGQPGQHQLSGPHDVPPGARHPLREPREPGPGGEYPVHLRRVPAQAPGRARRPDPGGGPRQLGPGRADWTWHVGPGEEAFMTATTVAADRDAAAREVAARMAAAAAAWLDALDPVQRAVAAGRAPSPDAGYDAERRRWFYTPTDHGGLPLGDQRPAQQCLAHQLVATGLSTAGYVTVATIIGLDNVLDQLEGWTVDWGRERGRDPGMYYLRVFGEPGGAEPWGWRFGGHHVSLNNLVADGTVVATTPCFFGADPAVSPLLGPAPLRPLAGPEDLARDLVRSLDPERAARATLLDRAPAD